MNVSKIDALARFSAESYNKIPIEGSNGLIRLLCFEPEQSVPLHKHSNGDEYFFVVDGRGKFTLGDEESTVPESCIVKAPAGIPHQWKNGSKRLVLLSVLIHPSSYALAERVTEMVKV
jgi:quercetin dioxygenase-like cupin family protein